MPFVASLVQMKRDLTKGIIMVTKAQSPMRLFIIGATGGIGRELVDQALARGHHVTAYVRSPQKLDSSQVGLLTIRGNVLDPDELAAALVGHDAVLSAIGPPGLGRNTITSDVAGSTMTAMNASGLRRLVIVGVAMLFKDSGFVGRLLRTSIMRNIAEDSAEMERIVTTSNIDWTIVRPPRLTNGPCCEDYGIADGQLPVGSGGGAATVSRADVAHFMLDTVEQNSYLRRIVGIAATRTRRRNGNARSD
jgi:putative NADH-flavin reductase